MEETPKNSGMKCQILSGLEIVLIIIITLWLILNGFLLFMDHGSTWRHNDLQINPIYWVLFIFFPFTVIYRLILAFAEIRLGKDNEWFKQQFFSIRTLLFYTLIPVALNIAPWLWDLNMFILNKQYEAIPEITEAVMKEQTQKFVTMPVAAFPISKTEFIFFANSYDYLSKKYIYFARVLKADIKTKKLQVLNQLRNDTSILTVNQLTKNTFLITGSKSLSVYTKVPFSKIYNIHKNSFIDTKPMHFVRSGYSSTALGNGQVLIAGGQPEDDSLTGALELFNEKTNQYTVLKETILPRSGHKAILLNNQEVVFVAGRGVKIRGDSPLNEVESYNLQTKTVTQIGKTKGLRLLQTLTPLDKDRLLLLGAYDSGVFNRKNGTFESIKKPPLCRFNRYYYPTENTTEVLKNGKVLILNSSPIISSDSYPCSVLNVFNPKTFQFEPIGKTKYVYIKPVLVELDKHYYVLNSNDRLLKLKI